MTLEARRKWVLQDQEGDVLAKLLKSRNLSESSEIEKFLNPNIDDIYDCTNLFDSKKAAQRILEAVKNDETIFIHGDFDADGVCASAILWEFLYKEVSAYLGLKVNVKPYIPSRVDEGYGLSKSSLDAIKNEGGSLVITVDCGIRDGELIKEYTNKNFEIIVTDHHQPPEDISQYKHIIVHQMYPENEYPYEKICGSAIAFFLTQAIRKELGMEWKVKDMQGLDLVALATVTDMMPLLDVNRVFVKFGLEQMQKGLRLGMNALLNLANVPLDQVDTYHLGFVVGPRINAAGRIGHAMDALRLILSPNEKSALEYSSQLQNLNTLRQENTQTILLEAEEEIHQFKDENLIFLIGNNWHEGVIGLVAGKIFEQTGKPTIVVTKVRDEIKGSARSIQGFNITKALEKFSKYLLKYGGHAQAAGFTVKDEKGLEKFKKDILKYSKDKIHDEDLVQELNIDIELKVEDISLELFYTMEKLKPYGFSNPKPLVKIKELEIKEKIVLSNGKHMKLVTENKGNTLTLLLFNCDEDIQKLEIGERLDIVGNIVVNEWKDKTNIEIQIKEWKKE